MDAFIIGILILDLSFLVAFAIRSLYHSWKFVNAIWIKAPEQARRYGIPSDSPFGNTGMYNAVYSKEKCLSPEIEQLRMNARNACKPCWYALAFFPFIMLGFIIPRILRIDTDSVDIKEKLGSLNWLILVSIIVTFIISTLIVVCISKSRKSR